MDEGQLQSLTNEYNQYESSGQLVEYADALCKLGDWDTYKLFQTALLNNGGPFTLNQLQYIYHVGKDADTYNKRDRWLGLPF